MANTPRSIEVQIDNFLEHFKRSASKAMDTDWITTESSPNYATTTTTTTPAMTAASFNHSSPLKTAKTRSSCFDISQLGSITDENDIALLPLNLTKSRSNNLHHSHQHIFQHQSSISSTTSVQTVFHNVDTNNGENTNNITNASNNQMILLGTSSSSASFQSANGTAHTVNANGYMGQSAISAVASSHNVRLNSAGSITSLTGGCSNAMFQQISNSSNVSIAEEALSIGDVADLLHPQYAIITGGRSREGCPIITFPDHNNFHLLNEHDYEKLISYLTSVPTLQEADLGFNLIIDRRKDRWTSVKSVLLRISSYFPGIIHVVYVIRPAGFFQKAISEVSSKFFKEDFKFRLMICASLDDLFAHVERSQVTQDLGGELMYSHHEWIQQRICLEKFSSLTHQVSCNLDIFMRVIHDTEFPNSVDATQKLLDEQGSEYERLKEEILAAAKHGERLLDDFRSSEIKEFSERTGNVSTTERLLVQLEETERRFDDFWNTHLIRLKQCLDLRRFEQDFRELQINFDSHLKIVSEMTEIGETVERVDTLIKDTKRFQKLCDVDIERAEEVVAIGQQLISVRGACPKEVVQPKCDELSRVCDMVTERLSRRLEILLKSRDLMTRVEKANSWCARGIELLASQRIEKCSISTEYAEESLQEIQQFVLSASEFCITSSPRELRDVFQESATPETKALVAQVLQRIDDVSLMCEKRVVCLKKLALKPKRPVQQVIPEPGVPLQPPGGAPHPLRLRSKSQQRRVDGSSSRPQSMEGPMDSGISLNGDTISSPDSDNSSQHHIQNQSDIETRKSKRGHVLAELLETERIYVAEMGSILRGYRDQIHSEEMASLVPPGLHGKEDILFGNLNELYTFHSEVFLKDLENCISTTELVALCFVQRRDTFYRLYSFYCQNIPRSERLRETLVDTHLFLQECQKRLGHKLPLAAYLLKPVQRITKYQLLLKDLLRFSDNGTCAKELQKALDCMLIVLKCVNDSMHQIAITGFPADLTQQGELLLQDSFQVVTESKKDIRLRQKTQQRHIFLYQKAMLFCKQATKTGHTKSTYQFKHYVKMSHIGLTESVRGDARKFEVWLQGRSEVHTIQAMTVEIKNKWVAEIKKVLLNQLEELKDEKIKQYGLSHSANIFRPLRQTVSWDTPNGMANAPQRAMSVDTNSTNSNETNRCSNISDESGPTPAAPISSSSSEQDNHEAGAWSSDYSNSEDEYPNAEDTAPGNRFVSLADYCAMGHSEVSMKEGDVVELLKIGCAGWWFIRDLSNNGAEGWAPAAFLDPIHRRTHRSGSKHTAE
ncbi:guanine nucleotide exchange factor DBS isoform X3 [Contarinia nasturtii]|uniref:guanine nucleotide exchange factor DBS isoform X3 n=1 Tax=Contarinia nasturtii TaxID=265458 RepID=UPI0012D3B8C9|nr:guanine nucleotide exchange factor DBS isoform X3 [Contarinia nasturtii]